MLKGKIAFLVLAHMDPPMVARLIRRLLPYGRAFLHIDGKQPLAPYEAVTPSGTTILKDRVRVSWGGFTMIQATLRLLETAVREMPDAERFVLLSGQDYPIGSLDEFVTMLEARPEHNFIRGFDVLESPVDRNKVLNARLLDDVLPYRPKGVLKRPVAFINRLVRKIDRETGRFRERKYPFDMKPVIGSQWWTITRPMAEHILKFVEANPAYSRHYRHSFAPDEGFFHTIALNSPLAAHADPIAPYQSQQINDMSNVHLIHESLGKTYALEDLDEILGSGKWFFRKVSSAGSTPLLDELDRRAGVATTVQKS